MGFLQKGLLLLLLFALTCRAEDPGLVNRGRNSQITGGDVSSATPPPHRRTERHTNYHIIAVKIPDSSDAEAERIARANGFTVAGKVTNLSDYYLFQRDINRRDEPHGLDSEGNIEWLEEQVPREQFTRLVDVETAEAQWTWPTDPMVEYQWHLFNPAEFPNREHNFVGNPVNIRVLPAWMAGYNGTGVNIGIVDDGLERDHPDTHKNVKRSLCIDINDADDDCTPSESDSHGQACAGLAAAVSNDPDTPSCGVGVAYGAKLAGIRLLGAWTTDADEANALGHACNGLNNDGEHVISIYTNSWGPADSGMLWAGPGRLTRDAIFHCITNGRGGLGSIYVWAGGNGAGNGDNVNRDRYASDMYTIAVGAVTDDGQKAWYSEPGSSLFCSVPSSGGTRGISTTDLKGHRGYSYSDCTRTFGGTSAASPQVAGVVALMLQANPTLTWRDVQHIIAESCAPVDRRPRLWHENSAGYIHSHLYGFGLLSAAVAVERSRTWDGSLLGARDMYSSGTTRVNTYINYNKIETFLFRVSEDEIPERFLEHVEVHIKADTPNGDGFIAMELCAPTNTCSTLITSGPATNDAIDWTFMTVRHWGEDVVNRGVLNDPARMARLQLDTNSKDPRQWRLHIWNTANRRSAPMYLRSWKLDFWGFSK